MNNQNYLSESAIITNLIENNQSKQNKDVNLQDNKKDRPTDKFMDKLKNWFNENKILKSKPIKYSLILALFLIVCVLVINVNFSNSQNNKIDSSNSTTYTYVSSLDYTKAIEDKFANMLSKINGIGEVSVMITLESSGEIILANTIDEKTNTTSSGNNSSSYTTTVTDPIIITANGTSSPLVVSETLPKIKGVVVVAEGIEKNVALKLNIINAVMALVDVPKDQIQVFSA